MSDHSPEPTLEQVRDAIAAWSEAPNAASAKAEEIGLHWYAVAVLVAGLVSALLSAGAISLVLWLWTPSRIDVDTWEIRHSSGRSELCTRTASSVDSAPGYTCVER